MAKNNSDNKKKQDTNLDLYQVYLNNQAAAQNLTPMNELAKEGQELLNQDSPQIVTDNPVETKATQPTIQKTVTKSSDGPYDRAMAYYVSKMDKWTKDRFNWICETVKKGNLIENAADQRFYDDLMFKVRSLGDDLSDGKPLPKASC
jgi:hypothetical protein